MSDNNIKKLWALFHKHVNDGGWQAFGYIANKYGRNSVPLQLVFGKNQPSPFRDTKDCNFRLYDNGVQGLITYCDYANDNQTGNCFDFTKNMLNCTDEQALEKIAEIYGYAHELGITSTVEAAYIPPKTTAPKQKKKSELEYIKFKKFTEEEYRFWKRKGNISRATLKKLNVQSVESFAYKNGQPNENLSMVFAFEILKDKAYKLYMPDESTRPVWISSKTLYLPGFHPAKEADPDFFYQQGLYDLEPNKYAYLFAGEADYLAAEQMGFNAFTFGSENSKPTQKALDFLKENNNTKTFVVYDTDWTGLHRGWKLAQEYKEHGFKQMLLPLDKQEVKYDAQKELYIKYNGDTTTSVDEDTITEKPEYNDLCDCFASGVTVKEIKKALRPPKLVNKPIGNLLNTQEALTEDNYQLPKGCIWEEVKEDVINYGVMMWDNRIYIFKESSPNQYYYRHLSNFAIIPLFLIEGQQNRRIVEIINVKNQKRTLELDIDSFITLSKFRQMVESKGNFQFDGSSTDLLKVRSYVYEKMKNCQEIRTLGYHVDGFYAFSNGIFNAKYTAANEFGIVEHDGEYYFIPFQSSIYKHDRSIFRSERKIRYEQKEVSFKDWSKLFVDVYGDNGKIGLAFYIASLFRDLLYNRLQFFPHLFGGGQRSSGKSQLGWSLHAMFYCEDEQPFNLTGSTNTAFYRKFSQVCNSIIFFDEYKNNLHHSRLEAIKAAYDGAGHQSGAFSNDNRTKRNEILSSCYIAGEHLPTANNAMFTRLIFCPFNREYKLGEDNRQEVENFKNLKELEHGGLTHITATISKYRDIVEQNLSENFRETERMISDAVKQHNVESRLIRNMAVLTSVYRCFAQHKAWERLLPITVEQLVEVCSRYLIHQNGLISHSKETFVFWDMFEHLVSENKLKEGKDYRLFTVDQMKIDNETVHFNGNKEVLHINLVNAYHYYREKMQKSSNSVALDKASLEQYLKHSEACMGKSQQRYDQGRKRGFVFDYEKLREIGVDFANQEQKDELLDNETDSELESLPT